LSGGISIIGRGHAIAARQWRLFAQRSAQQPHRRRLPRERLIKKRVRCQAIRPTRGGRSDKLLGGFRWRLPDKHVVGCVREAFRVTKAGFLASSTVCTWIGATRTSMTARSPICAGIGPNDVLPRITKDATNEGNRQLNVTSTIRLPYRDALGNWLSGCARLLKTPPPRKGIDQKPEREFFKPRLNEQPGKAVRVTALRSGDSASKRDVGEDYRPRRQRMPAALADGWGKILDGQLRQGVSLRPRWKSKKNEDSADQTVVVQRVVGFMREPAKGLERWHFSG